jgi:predicted nucleotidyltransferase
MGIKKHSVADALFSKVQQRVLGVLFGQPDRSFYTNEIIRLTSSGTGAVQRELAKLAEVELITLKQQGNQKQYQANQHAHLFSELRGIVLKTFGLVDVLREALSPVSSHIEFAFIYGSVAKQEDKVGSDIDVMLLGEGLSYAEIYPLLESAQMKLGRLVNPTCYSKGEWSRKRKEGNNFINQVTEQPKIFITGSEDDLIAFG